MSINQLSHEEILKDLASIPDQRAAEAMRLRLVGMTYANIGKWFGVSGTRASQMVCKAESMIRQPKLTTLPARAWNCLRAKGITSKEEALRAFQSGEIYPGSHPYYGRKMHLQVCRWLGVEFSETTLEVNPTAVRQYIEYLEKRGYKVTKKSESAA